MKRKLDTQSWMAFTAAQAISDVRLRIRLGGEIWSVWHGLGA